MQKTNKVPDTGLALFTKASGALSMGWRLREPSREGLRSLGRKVNPEGLCAPRDQPEKERDRERGEGEKEGNQDMGTKALMEQRCFIQHCVFVLSYKAAIFSKDKIKTYKPPVKCFLTDKILTNYTWDKNFPLAYNILNNKMQTRIARIYKRSQV